MYDDADVISETTGDDGTPLRVILERDEYGDTADSPRDYDGNVGRIVAITRDSRNGDAPQEDDPGSDGRYSRANAASIVDAIQDHPFRVVSRWLRIFHGASVVLPLWDVSTTYGAPELSAGHATDNPGADRYAGVVFDTPATRKASGIALGHVEAALRDEVNLYAAWARGDVYGYIIQYGELDEHGDVVDWDSVWGHIGREWAEESAREALKWAVGAHNERVAQQRAEAAAMAAEDHDAALAELAGADLPEAVPAS